MKTLYLLRFIDDESYRRRILVQLNRGEGRHQLARVIFHGKRGELRQRYREGQEDQLGALGLVVNLIVLWNTIYMKAAAMNQLSAEGYEARPENIARLSPLGHKHVKMLGRYAFPLPTRSPRRAQAAARSANSRGRRGVDKGSRREPSGSVLSSSEKSQCCPALSASSASSLITRKNSLDWPMKSPSAVKPWMVATAPPC